MMKPIVSERRLPNPYDIRDMIFTAQRKKWLNELNLKDCNGTISPFEKLELYAMKTKDIVKDNTVIMYQA